MPEQREANLLPYPSPSRIRRGMAADEIKPGNGSSQPKMQLPGGSRLPAIGSVQRAATGR